MEAGRWACQGQCGPLAGGGAGLGLGRGLRSPLLTGHKGIPRQLQTPWPRARAAVSDGMALCLRGLGFSEQEGAVTWPLSRRQCGVSSHSDFPLQGLGRCPVPGLPGGLTNRHSSLGTRVEKSSPQRKSNDEICPLGDQCPLYTHGHSPLS